MIRIKKILYPTDFSDYAKYALRYALSFAEQYDAKVYILNVVEEFLHDPLYFAPHGEADKLHKGFVENAKKKMEELARSPELKGIVTEIVIKLGKPFYEIIQLAKAEEIDIIVIATHGTSGLAHAFFGSVSERVVRKAPCPVLSIRHPEHEFIMP